MTLKLILDRVEENSVAVLTDDERKIYECSVSLLPEGYRENDSYLGELNSEGKLVSLTKRQNPDAGKNGNRLRALFQKSKNKSKLK